jgi:hypothetical protein
VLQQNRKSHPRYKKMFIGSLSVNVIHRSRPWVAAWWSVALPGFGHIQLGLYIKGFILMAGEIVFNLFGHVNAAMYYTFLGQFQRANQVLNYQWTTLYCAIFVFAIFDSYRVAVEINKMAWLESRQKIRDLTRSVVQGFDLNALDKRVPWVSAFWSFVFTGLGHIYCHRIVTGSLLLGWTVTVSFQAKLPYLVIFTLTGQFQRLHELAVDYEWALFFPSIYCFGIYDAYQQSVVLNNLFKEEQIYHLHNKYGKNPITLENSKSIIQNDL